MLYNIIVNKKERKKEYKQGGLKNEIREFGKRKIKREKGF